MNFKVISLILYLFGELEHIFAVQTTSIIYLSDDSEEKKTKVKYVNELLFQSLSYRYALEERARIEANVQKNEFESKTGTEYWYTWAKPSESAILKYWNQAEQAEKNYIKIRDKFVWERLCNELEKQFACEEAIKDPYFEKEKLTLDPDKSGFTDCVEISFDFWRKNWFAKTPVNFKMRYKRCYAMKENEDGSKHPVIFYLQSVYQKPTFGRLKYFVLYGYMKNPETEVWERVTDPNIEPEDITFRYEAFLIFGFNKESKLVTLPWGIHA